MRNKTAGTTNAAKKPSQREEDGTMASTCALAKAPLSVCVTSLGFPRSTQATLAEAEKRRGILLQSSTVPEPRRKKKGKAANIVRCGMAKNTLTLRRVSEYGPQEAL